MKSNLTTNQLTLFFIERSALAYLVLHRAKCKFPTSTRIKIAQESNHTLVPKMKYTLSTSIDLQDGLSRLDGWIFWSTFFQPRLGLVDVGPISIPFCFPLQTLSLSPSSVFLPQFSNKQQSLFHNFQTNNSLFFSIFKQTNQKQMQMCKKIPPNLSPTHFSLHL